MIFFSEHRVEREILRKKSFLPFLPIQLISAVKGTKKLNKPRERRFGGWKGAHRRLSNYWLLGPSRSFSLCHATTRSLSLSLTIPRSLSISLTITRSLTLFFGPSHSLPLFLVISGHHTVSLTPSRSFS